MLIDRFDDFAIAHEVDEIGVSLQIIQQMRHRDDQFTLCPQSTQNLRHARNVDRVQTVHEFI